MWFPICSFQMGVSPKLWIEIMLLNNRQACWSSEICPRLTFVFDAFNASNETSLWMKTEVKLKKLPKVHKVRLATVILADV